MYCVILMKRNKMEVLNYRERQGKTMDEIESSSRMMGYSFLVLLLIAGCSIFFKQFEKKSISIAKAKQETLYRSQASR
jgi:hypothetical protein